MLFCMPLRNSYAVNKVPDFAENAESRTLLLNYYKFGKYFIGKSTIIEYNE